MARVQLGVTPLINDEEAEHYYNFLLKAFREEFLGVSRRDIVENIALKAMFSERDAVFLRNIVDKAFRGKRSGHFPRRPAGQRLTQPIELLNYIVAEGYTPSSPFVIWAYRKLHVKWDVMHWFRFMRRDIAPVDLRAIRREIRSRSYIGALPQTLEIYYRLGAGIERPSVHPDLGIRNVIRQEYQGQKRYRGFDPLEYLDYYYGGLDREDMTIAKTLYGLLTKHRSELPRRTTALIVGNGPVADEAQTLAMIPEIRTIVPADIDPRNIKIMRMHTGRRNPMTTQKARSGEEHADYIYYMFERATGTNQGLFAVREITSVKTRDPIYIDIRKADPLRVRGNTSSQRRLRAQLVVVPFCPESITSSQTEYRRLIQNISRLVPSRGALCMLALKNARFYLSGLRRLSAVPVDEALVSEALQQNGFRNIEIQTIQTGWSPKSRGFSDSMAIWATRKT